MQCLLCCIGRVVLCRPAANCRQGLQQAIADCSALLPRCCQLLLQVRRAQLHDSDSISICTCCYAIQRPAMQPTAMSHLCRSKSMGHCRPVFILRLTHAVHWQECHHVGLTCNCARRVLLTPELLRRLKDLEVWPSARSGLVLVASLLTTKSCRLSGFSSNTALEAAPSSMLGAASGICGWLTKLGDAMGDSAKSAGGSMAGSVDMGVMCSAVEDSCRGEELTRGNTLTCKGVPMSAW